MTVPCTHLTLTVTVAITFVTRRIGLIHVGGGMTHVSMRFVVSSSIAFYLIS